jgi:hypothetical protein
MMSVSLNGKARWAAVVGLVAAALTLVALLLGRPEAAHSVDPPAPASANFAALRGAVPQARLAATQQGMIEKVAAGATPQVAAGAAAKGARAYLAQAGPAVCLVTDLGNGVGPVSCSADAPTFAKDDLNALVTIGGDGYVVSGAAPDGVHGLSLTTADGSQNVDITNNTFLVNVSSRPIRIDWVDGAGAPGSYTFINPDITLRK